MSNSNATQWSRKQSCVGGVWVSAQDVGVVLIIIELCGYMHVCDL